jgi:outer membrane protein OmpA-like peptidoglycan-associated protein
MAAVAMETAKMLKKMKNTKMIIAGYTQNRN